MLLQFATGRIIANHKNVHAIRICFALLQITTTFIPIQDSLQFTTLTQFETAPPLNLMLTSLIITSLKSILTLQSRKRYVHGEVHLSAV